MKLPPKAGTSLALAVVAIMAIAAVILWPHTTNAPGPNPNVQKTDKAIQSKKNRYPLNRANSPWVIVNKGRRLPADYVPAKQAVNGLRTDTNAALTQLLQAAAESGLPMQIVSGFRSYSYQVGVYNNYVKQFGQAQADTFSARPGHSEHQTGLAIDLAPQDGRCRLDQCFGQTAEGKWLAANAYRFGFIIRYGQDQDKVTGYEYEPWHIRYVGKWLAAQIHQSGQTLEQYFGLPAITIYPAQSLLLK